MNKNRTSSIAIIAALSVALLSGCEPPSLSGLLSSESNGQPAGEGTQATTVEPNKEETTRPQRATLAETIKDVDGVPTVTNATDLSVVVNKQRALPGDYIPPDLVEPNVPFPFDEKVEKRLLRAEAAQALEELFAKAKTEGIELYAVSGYRSYKTQKSLYETYVRTQGAEHAAAYSAVPGKSEHQTGLAMDVSGHDASTRLEESFGETPEGLWLAANCADFGFVIRYLKGKEDTTGYAYEPWHLRYVGKEMAKEIMAGGLTLEDYFSEAAIAHK
ncbi:M15 family metallopeptidase [Brevibacillus brevis]|uniref:M15 family metallopeptidase n=1 Tax=Brevibacillus brevis TaxID=1393 RepID=UPI001157447F|nr:M15 family metallopeptidase [Lysinibacillus sp. SDF0063]TQR36387.1 D-alanyl-D-alanine carboxypeptidase family protein [Lysinibacillus sp. SDF0063]